MVHTFSSKSHWYLLNPHLLTVLPSLPLLSLRKSISTSQSKRASWSFFLKVKQLNFLTLLLAITMSRVIVTQWPSATLSSFPLNNFVCHFFWLCSSINFLCRLLNMHGITTNIAMVKITLRICHMKEIFLDEKLATSKINKKRFLNIKTFST
jgi:hypothetical protein